MTEKHMQHLLNTRPGVGAEVVTSDGLYIYYFYEDFPGEESGISRAMRQLYPGLDSGRFSKVVFISKGKK